MRIPLEVSFHGLSRSETIEEIIRSDAAKLEKICDRLISCRVGIKLDQKSSTAAKLFRIKIEMRVPPGHNLVVTNTADSRETAGDLHGSIKNTFKAAQRRLKQLVDKQQGEKKHHPEQEIGGIVQKVFSNEGYGFLRSLDGEEIYFHRNSVVGDRFGELEPGSGVQYVAEIGDKGLQATTVQIIEKTSGRQQEEDGGDIVSPLGWQRQKS